MSTVGEALINPDCLTTSSSASELFYNKQAGFAAVPFIAVFVSFVFWYVYGHVKKTPFFFKAPKRLSMSTTVRLAGALKRKASSAKAAISYHTAENVGEDYVFNNKTGEKTSLASGNSTLKSEGRRISDSSVGSENKGRTVNVSGSDKKKPSRKKRLSASSSDSTTPKDKFIVTVTMVVYLIFPTLCQQAFQIFDCKTVAEVQYLAIDLEHPCYEGDHMVAVLTLGISQLALFVVGLPLLVLYFLRRNRKRSGGLNRLRVRVRYGLFFVA